MTLLRLLLKSLVFHWRGNVAVFLGVVVGTAVLTGALFVGDSLRGSLRDLTLRRLGWVDEALVAPRFFREALADELQAAGAAERVVPAILLQATAVSRDAEGMPVGRPPRFVRRVTVVGVDERFWDAWPESKRLADPRRESRFGAKPWLNRTLAEALGVRYYQEFSLRLQKPSAIPPETILGRREEKVDDWILDVGNILHEGEPANSFSLQPTLEAPRVAFVPLSMLQSHLGLRGRVNALLVGKPGKDLPDSLRQRLTLADWGLTLTGPRERVAELFAKLDKDKDGTLTSREWRDRFPAEVARQINPEGGRFPALTRDAVEKFYDRERNYLSLESRNLILETAIGEAARKAADTASLRAAPTFVYLANAISAGEQRIPYSIVAALDPSQAAPLGPFLPAGADKLADDQIVLAAWKDSPLKNAIPGDMIAVTYFDPDVHGTPKEKTDRFRLAGFVPLQGVSGDPDLTPEFPGITDALSLDAPPDKGGWDPPFPYDNKRIQPRDDQFWKDYRTTPKAYVTLATGQRLWGSRFGDLTSIRLAGMDLTKAKAHFETALLEQLDPARGGFVFDKVKENALAASAQGTDFSVLFLAFSFFLIAAALLLIGLLFRLNLDQRGPEIGLLLATGYRPTTVRRLLLAEGAMIALAGVIVGDLAAMAYAGLLLRYLGAVWPGGHLQTLLQPHFTATSLVLGAAGSLLASVLTIWWAVRVLGRVTPPALLAGQTTTAEVAGRPPRWAWAVVIVSLLGAGILQVAGPSIKDHEAQAGSFFGSGSLLLTASLAALWGWMRGTRHRPVEGGGWWGVARLGVRNAARHPSRSLLTAGLLASAAFLLVAVEAFRRHAEAGAQGKDSGSGGFALLAESDIPIFQDLNSDDFREDLRGKLEIRYREALRGDNRRAQQQAADDVQLLRQVTVFPFRVRAGDDASCLNLYQPRRPRLLGVPEALIERGGFQFAAVEGAKSGDPWRVLESADEPVPVFGENNTVIWQLRKGLGGTLSVPDGRGAERPLKIAGLLRDSVFQSGLLLSEKNFLRFYPGTEGFTFFLIETPAGRENRVKELLDAALIDRGFEATLTAKKLAEYLDVENTYISTFQALGGLGLILGSLGLAVVLLRGVWERRGELALLRALGWRRGTLGWLMLAENGALLLIGLGAGAASALIAVAPHLGGAGGSPPWLHMLELLGVVLLVGLVAGSLAVASTLRAPLVPALRRE